MQESLTKWLEDALLFAGALAALKTLMGFAFVAFIYYDLINGASSGNTPEMLEYHEAYQIIIIYSVIASIASFSSLLTTVLEFKQKEHFGVIHWLSSLGTSVFLINVIYVYSIHFIENSNQHLYEIASMSVSSCVIGITAA